FNKYPTINVKIQNSTWENNINQYHQIINMQPNSCELSSTSTTYTISNSIFQSNKFYNNLFYFSCVIASIDNSIINLNQVNFYLFIYFFLINFLYFKNKNKN